ncbi:SAM-dependent methyltransferase [Bacteroidia bacterium]|nr:SAM-dependent methyltransferase [Bacteroidia bacterium]MDB9882540.1 SAM-dependent methyltransferase [Bacteroidia bacterium]MDC1395307.1 SAM-dependent methyltransferase [Bacteroidia bacterium]
MSKTLYLVPNFIGEFDKEYLPKRTLEHTYKITHFIVEREKTARAFLKAIQHPTPQNDFVFVELDKHNNYVGFKMFFNEHIGTQSIGVLSEAGLPAIADPGSEVAKYAHSKGVQVVPLSGSSSIFLALMASGFNGQNFKFNGYLPIDNRDRMSALKDMEVHSRKSSQIFMEAPYRNNQFLEFLIKNLQNDTKLCVAVDIEKEGKETIISKPVSEWKPREIELHKKPTIFIIEG